LLVNKITSTYTYFPNLFVSPWHNAIRVITERTHETSALTKITNLAFHNLVVGDQNLIPTSVQKLLGLSLKYCLQPATSKIDHVDLARFDKDYRRRMFWAGDKASETPILYYPNKDYDPRQEYNEDLTRRRLKFQKQVTSLFRAKRRNHPNLLPSQQAALSWLKQHPEYIVFNTDKNLGPAIIEREEYIRLAWRDHLSDTTTYRQLSDDEYNSRIRSIYTNIKTFLEIFKTIDKSNREYISRKLDDTSTGNEAAFMYLLAKIHKSPMKTRAIISYAGNYCSGIAKWVDIQLQKVVKHMPYVAKSSATVIADISKQEWPPGSRLFTMDAVSMYTNIHLGHALPVILNFLKNTDKGRAIVKLEKLNIAAVAAALEFVMTNNVFTFGDTHWLQIAGTAMGTPPAPDYATLYYAIHEYSVIDKYPEIKFYCRYIDDGFGIWHNIERENETWTTFQNDINSFGTDHEFFTEETQTLKPLVWEFSNLDFSTVFLDLNLSISETGTISSSIYEKALNLHLYIPPTSCHAPGVLKGLIYGCVHRAITLCTKKEDRLPYIKKTITRLVKRGHDRHDITLLFDTAIRRANSQGNTYVLRKKHQDQDALKPLFLHLPFNPANPPTPQFQRTFRDCILSPPSEPHIREIETHNAFAGVPDFDRLVVCYHGQKNLGNILSPRKLRLGATFSVQNHLDLIRGNP
jgi:hypothetical protein